jgi:hypothetical protein
MFCPKCGHQQNNEATRYCSRCGLLLDGVTDFLDSNDARIESAKREVLGSRLAFTAMLVSFIYLIVLGALALPQIAEKSTFLTVWIIYLAVALGLSSTSITLLVRSGFFKKLKEREKRVQSIKAPQKRNEIEAVKESVQANTNPSLRLPELVSVTETTTRNLEENSATSRRAKESL